MIEPSDEQRAAIRAVVARLRAGAKEVTLGGLAGTGKTTIAACLPVELGLKPWQVAYCAPTGKAARVITGKLDDGYGPASTIHSLIYRPQELHCGQCRARYDLEAQCHGYGSCGCRVVFDRSTDSLDPSLRLIIVDEASMVTLTIRNDLVSCRVPIVWIGDHGQLPPVGDDSGLMSNPDVRLETIHRQVAGSPILQLAMRARAGKPIPLGNYGPGVAKIGNDGGVVIDDSTEKWRDVLVLCQKRDTRVEANDDIRSLLDLPRSHPVIGDRLICLRNNHAVGIANGMTGTLLHIERWKGAYKVDIEVDGEKGIYSGHISREQFGQKETLHTVRGVDLWDYGYCITVHKAQGSEARRVFLFDEYPKYVQDRRRWLYTGITRAQERLTIISC